MNKNIDNDKLLIVGLESYTWDYRKELLNEILKSKKELKKSKRESEYLKLWDKMFKELREMIDWKK